MLYQGALHGLGPREARARARDLVGRIGLADRLKDRVRPLSGGQARRIEIARALLHAPRLVLLDEPTAGLDIKARADILALTRRLVEEDGIGVLWTTHLVDEVRPDDQVVVLHKGRVLASDRRGAIMAAAGANIDRRGLLRLTTAAPERRTHERVAEARRPFGLAGYWFCLQGIVWRESLRFLHQRERFVSALVRPLVWLFIFAAGFRQTLGISIIPPYETYVLYDVYITPGPDRDDPAVQRHAVVAVDGLRPRDGLDAHAARQPRAALVPADLEAARGVAVSILQVYAYLVIAYFWEIEPPTWWGYLDDPAGAGAVGPDARRARHGAVVADQAARELRRRDELRDLPDVLRLLRALSALAGAGGKPVACDGVRAEPVHPRGRAHPLRLLGEVRSRCRSRWCSAARSCSSRGGRRL